MKNVKLSLILMDDDGATRRYRVRRSTVRFFIFMTFFLPVVCGGLIYGSYLLYEKNLALEYDNKLKVEQAVKYEAEIEKLSNLEAIRQSEIEALKATINKKEDDALIAHESQSSEPVNSDEVEAPKEEKALEEYLPVDSGIVSLENVSARLIEGKKLRLSIDLHNATQSQISGGVVLYVLSSQGQRSPLDLSNSDYKIVKMKKIVSAVTIPNSIGNMTNASLMVEVLDSTGKIIHRQLFPIES